MATRSYIRLMRKRHLNAVAFLVHYCGLSLKTAEALLTRIIDLQWAK